jgi:uncharacterized phiE125 gp8 family phage protein
VNWDRLSLTGVEGKTGGTVLTVADLKSQSLIDTGDDDAYLAGLCAAVQAAFEGPNGCGIAFIQQQWKMTLDYWPPVAVAPFASMEDMIRLPLWPVMSVDSLNYIDTGGNQQTLDPSNYITDLGSNPARIARAFGRVWPPTLFQLGSVQVIFTAGFGVDATTVPQDLKQGMMMLAGHYYENREAVTDGRVNQPFEVPFGVQAIMDRYRVGRFG